MDISRIALTARRSEGVVRPRKERQEGEMQSGGKDGERGGGGDVGVK